MGSAPVGAAVPGGRPNAEPGGGRAAVPRSCAALIRYGDLTAQTVRVSRQLVELRGGGFGFAPPKSDAGKRVVCIPAVIMPVIGEHVGHLSDGDPDGLIFTSPEGTPLRHSNFRQRVWLPALRSAGLPLIHFHDLRHTGNMLAAGAGAGLRELMERMGHSTTRAALTYLHPSDERQPVIADAMSKIGAGELKRRGSLRSGT
jgi:integrase